MIDDNVLGKVIGSILADANTTENKLKIFGVRINNVLKEFLECYFEQTEGSACCADKAGFTMAMIKKSIEKKQYLPLQQTYREYQEAGGNIGSIKELDRVCFWCPEQLKTTEEAIDLLCTFINKIPSVTRDIINNVKTSYIVKVGEAWNNPGFNWSYYTFNDRLEAKKYFEKIKEEKIQDIIDDNGLNDEDANAYRQEVSQYNQGSDYCEDPEQEWAVGLFECEAK